MNSSASAARKSKGCASSAPRPAFLANERLRRVLFGEHPYAIIAPTEEQVAAYRREQLEDFYRRNYSPANALLIVVGDFASDAMLDQIEKVFGGWKAPQPETPQCPAPPRNSGRQVHLVHLPGSVQTQVLLGNLAITRRDPDWFRLVLANSIYGGAFHSRLVMNIREQKGYTYSPRSGVSRSASTDISPCTPQCATKSPQPRSPKCSTKWTACARCR